MSLYLSHLLCHSVCISICLCNGVFFVHVCMWSRPSALWPMEGYQGQSFLCCFFWGTFQTRVFLGGGHLSRLDSPEHRLPRRHVEMEPPPTHPRVQSDLRRAGLGNHKPHSFLLALTAPSSPAQCRNHGSLAPSSCKVQPQCDCATFWVAWNLYGELKALFGCVQGFQLSCP